MKPSLSTAVIIITSMIALAMLIFSGTYLVNSISANSRQKTETFSMGMHGRRMIGAPISYNLNNLPVSVATTSTAFPYTATQLQAFADECGTTYSEGYFNDLVDQFSQEVVKNYTFTYTGESQEPRSFTITAVPNVVQYASDDAFLRDFNICGAGADLYPETRTSEWLILESSCGTGFKSESNLPIGCEKAREIVLSSLKIN